MPNIPPKELVAELRAEVLEFRAILAHCDVCPHLGICGCNGIPHPQETLPVDPPIQPWE